MAGGAARHLRNRSGVNPLAPGRHLVQFTIDDADLERLQYALQLLSHRNPEGNLAFLNRVAVDLLITELENQKLGITDDPRGGGESTADNVRLLCRAHNQWAAECTYGVGFMEAKQQEARLALNRET